MKVLDGPLFRYNTKYKNKLLESQRTKTKTSAVKTKNWKTKNAAGGNTGPNVAKPFSVVLKKIWHHFVLVCKLRFMFHFLSSTAIKDNQ